MSAAVSVSPAVTQEVLSEEGDLLEDIVFELVSHPESLKVVEQVEGNVTTFVVQVDPRDRGQVIGRNGDTITSLCRVFGSIAARKGRKAFIRLAEKS